ncbi:MAG: hypothetical protein IJR82_02570 [Bacilli bacterium]|nr:hypothetical protein [Bacilli bacterium]
MEQVLDKIKQKIKILQQTPFSKQEELTFLTTFLEDYQLTYDKISLIHIKDNCEMLLGVIVGKKIMSYFEAKALLENPVLKTAINNLKNDEESCKMFVNDIINLERYGIDSLEYCTASPIFFNSAFIEFVKKINDLSILDCLNIFINIKREIAEICLQCLSSIEKKEDIEDLINTTQNDCDMKIYADLTGNNIRHRIKSLKKEKTQFESDIAKKIQMYQQIYNYLSNNILINDILFINEIDEDMKQSILEAILLHNENFYLELSQQRSGYDNNIKGIFKLNGFNFDKIATDEQQRLLENGDVDNIRTILPIIKKEPFFIGINDCYLVDILLYSTNNIITKITNLYKKGYIDISFIQQNKGILFNSHNSSKNIGLYGILKNNLRILRDNKLDIKAIKESNPHVLLMNTDDLTSILELFKKYQINLNNQPGNDYAYLTNGHIFEIIDLFIELGHERFARNNLELLSHLDEYAVKRIYISSMVIGNCDTIDDYLLSGTTYPIKNGNLDNFIINNTPQYINPNIIEKFQGYKYEVMPIIEFIDKHFQGDNDNVYYFDDIVISRNKVIRNLANYQVNNKSDEESFMTIILNAIINNSILDNDQINTIMQALNKVFSINKKVL